MTDPDLLHAVAEAIRRASEAAEHAEIAPRTRLIEDLGLDSLDLVAVMMNLQDAHDIELDLDAVTELQTVEDLMGELGRQVRGRSAA